MELLGSKKIVEKGLDFSTRIIDSIKSKIKVLCLSLLLTGNAPAADNLSAKSITDHNGAPASIRVPIDLNEPQKRLPEFKIIHEEIKYFYSLLLFFFFLSIWVIGHERHQSAKIEMIMEKLRKKSKA